jgi:hypothetical protein
MDLPFLNQFVCSERVLQQFEGVRLKGALAMVERFFSKAGQPKLLAKQSTE